MRVPTKTRTILFLCSAQVPGFRNHRPHFLLPARASPDVSIVFPTGPEPSSSLLLCVHCTPSFWVFSNLLCLLLVLVPQVISSLSNPLKPSAMNLYIHWGCCSKTPQPRRFKQQKGHFSQTCRSKIKVLTSVGWLFWKPPICFLGGFSFACSSHVRVS